MSKLVKVCHVVDKLETGGMENGLVNICNLLDRNKFKLSVCCINGIGEMAKRLNTDVEIADLHFGEGKYPLRFLRLAKFFRKNKPDIVHTHGWGACSFDGILGARMARVPAVINGEHGTFYLKKYQIIAQKLLSIFCDITLSVSNSLKKEIESTLGICQKRIFVIPNGVDTKIFNGNYESKNMELGLLKNRRNDWLKICSIGSLKPIKNQVMLLKALKLVLNENFGTKIVVIFAGDGPDMPMLRNYVFGNGLSEYVVFLGKRDDIPELLSIADIFVSTSKKEGAPNVILEAMASNVPVIATRSRGAEEYIQDGENGFLVEQDDFLGLKNRLLIFLDKDKRAKISKAARDSVFRTYSIEKMIYEYESLYLNLYNKKINL